MSRRVLAPLPRGSPAPEVALLSSAVPSRPGVFRVSRPLLRSAAPPPSLWAALLPVAASAVQYSLQPRLLCRWLP